jgi:hypothetical protein
MYLGDSEAFVKVLEGYGEFTYTSINIANGKIYSRNRQHYDE